MAYDTAGLHQAGTDHHELAAGIDPIVSQLGRLSLEPGVLGLLPSAATFATALDHARLGCATAAGREVADRDRQGQRTTTAAMTADKLTARTRTALGDGGEPGLGTDDVKDLHVPAGHTAAIRAYADPVASFGVFGDKVDGMPGSPA